VSENNSSQLAILERLIPWVVLVILAIFTYAFFFQAPYLGFRYSSDAEVVEVYVQESELRPGDRIESIGSVTWDAFSADLRQTWLGERRFAGVVPLRFVREGQEQTISWTLPSPTFDEVLQRLNSQWWLGYIFWLAGTATLFLIRPRNQRWLLLIAFNYLTAIWLTAGTTSSWHVWLSGLVLRSAVWLSVPVYLHLHWAFPSSLGRLPAPILWLGYGAAFVLAVVQWLQVIPASAYLYGFLLALLGSIVLLLLHVVRRPADRLEVGFLAAAVALVALPPISMSIATLLGAQLPGPLQGASFLAFPALPGVYFFIVYRQQLDRRLASRANRLAALYLFLIFLGTAFITAVALALGSYGLAPSNVFAGAMATVLAALMTIISYGPFLFLPALAGAYVPTASSDSAALHFRANRLVVPFLFFVILSAALALFILLLFVTLDFPGAPIVISVAGALLAAVAVAVGYRRFQQLVDRYLLGVPLPPARLLEAFAARITTSLESDVLDQLLADEVLPTLLVRQSAILLLDDSAAPEPILTYGLSEQALPEKEEVAEMVANADAGDVTLPIPRTKPGPAWIRLALPLNYGGRTIGLWLLGRRDPDDLYSRAELPLFQTLANQMAVALTNLIQTENLRVLYRENIDRHEAERARLARALHDEVLSQLAVLVLFSGEEIRPESRAAYDAVTARLRRTISGLRPAMLQYGLYAALSELVDELSERTGGDPAILSELLPSDARYAAAVEQHLFRIIQQAVENALKHAQAETIYISGRLTPEKVELSVEDDGIGLAADKQLNLAGLLASKHFGLAGMYERAELIQADLRIESTPGRGTHVAVSWTAPEAPAEL
jgi:signal transduction histidine kinase